MIKDKSIFIKNIYYMLSYAFTTLNQGGYEDVATEEFENMHNLFAAILAKGISRQLKQGLYREYLNRKEDVAVVRGKIDMPGTMQNLFARKRILACEYDNLSENNLLNQILQKDDRDENLIREVFESALDTSEKDEVMIKIADEYCSQIKALFNKDPGNQDSDKLADYKMTFYVKPEFFELNQKAVEWYK